MKRNTTKNPGSAAVSLYFKMQDRILSKFNINFISFICKKKKKFFNTENL